MINARKNKLKKQMKNINSRSLFSKQQRKKTPENVKKHGIA